MRNDPKKQLADLMTRMFDLDLSPDSSKYEIQQQFKKFMDIHEDDFQSQIELNTMDLHNNGDFVSLHIRNDEYLLLCDMEHKTIEVSKLKDYEKCLFDVIETVDFSFPKLSELARTLVNQQ